MKIGEKKGCFTIKGKDLNEEDMDIPLIKVTSSTNEEDALSIKIDCV